MISIDGQVFVKEPATGNTWKEYLNDPDSQAPEARRILSTKRRFSTAPEFVPAMDEAVLVGREVIDGLSVYHTRGTGSFKQEVPENLPADITDGMPLRLSNSTYHLYVSAGDFLPRRLVTETNTTWETSSGGQPGSENTGIDPFQMKSTDDYLDYNLPVNIELPKRP
jgi:hypothetical protein